MFVDDVNNVCISCIHYTCCVFDGSALNTVSDFFSAVNKFFKYFFAAVN